MTAQVSGAGAGLIAADEGIYLFAYPDPAHGWKVPTIGAGHTAAAGGLVPVRGMTISLATVCNMLLDDLNRKYVVRVARAIHRRLDQPVIDGFTSFDFNTGAISSGSVDERWNRGDEAGALDVLHQYVNAGGKRLPGLVTRRMREAKLISDGQYPSVLVLVRTSPGDPGRRVQVTALPWGQSSGPHLEIAPSVTAPVTPAPTAPLAQTPTRVSVWQRFLTWIGS